MPKTPIRTMRLADETWNRWEAEAHDRGYDNVSEFIRGCVEAEIGEAVPTAKKKKSVTPALLAGGRVPRGDLGATEVRPMFKGGK